MNLSRPHSRLISAICLFFVLGLQCMSAMSMSHALPEHFQVADGAGHHVHDHKDHDHDHDHDHHDDDGATKSHAHHSHHHGSDHTHDIPLRTRVFAASFSFKPIWEMRPTCDGDSIVQGPLERPPMSGPAA